MEQPPQENIAMDDLKAVVFDLDDTLYPEREYVRSGFRAVGEWAEQRLGLSQAVVRAELQGLFDGEFHGDTFQWWLSEQGLPESLLAEMVRVFRSHAPRIVLYPDAEQVLDELKPKVRLGLVTEGRRENQQAKIRALGLDRWISAIVILGEDDRAEWKPSRKPFDRVLALLPAVGKEAVYVGDNPRKDFRGARETGMATVRIRRQEGLHALDEPAAPADAPDREIGSLEQLMAALGKGAD
jgi:putative hydrolase of the HAD superfamily